MTFYPYLWHGAFDQVGDVVLGISQAGQTVWNLQVLHDQSKAIPQNRTRVLDLLVCYVYPCKFYTTKLAFKKKFTNELLYTYKYDAHSMYNCHNFPK